MNIETKATGWTFAQVPIWLICNGGISDGAKATFAYLKYRQGKDPACFPTKGTIAEDMDVSTQTITRRLDELEEAGYIKKHLRPGRSNLYELVADPGNQQMEWEKRQAARRERRDPLSEMTPPTDDTTPPIKSDTPPSPKSGTTPPIKNDTHDDTQRQEKQEQESEKGKTHSSDEDFATCFGEPPNRPERKKHPDPIGEVQEAHSRMVQRDHARPEDVVTRLYCEHAGMKDPPEGKREKIACEFARIIGNWGGATPEQAALAWRAYCQENDWREINLWYKSFEDGYGQKLQAVKDGTLTARDCEPEGGRMRVAI